ncbi:ABC transporter ATP-binding protein [Salisediminibacterium selenitireducens]|uniref:ABC transporter related protein n=1 Tax=Bacillus selenitireducens (strain ATCC 700615 / DSM 15326 / MLS10) TaxID=439292 RepID=D6XYB6_BACIE|nr:ABC transporter ATP-binding protein [Salisediminibacterium selenitireducens]ADI00185.1 ABC transporter related protein [[Bacillus] selenitireducens MLS10]
MALLTVEHLTKQFGSFSAVRDVSFTVQEGVCATLLGPNGAGKTTTLNMITGLSTPTSGTIALGDGYTLDRRHHLGYLPQHPSFFNWMSAEEYLRFSGELAGLTRQEANERARVLLGKVGLDDAARKRIAGFSGGMKQRLGIAQALIHKPALVILDEPVSALDPFGRREVLDLMQELKKETSILFSTHVLNDAEQVSDDVYMMKGGSLVMSGSLTEVQASFERPVIHLATALPIGEWLDGKSSATWITSVEASELGATLGVTDIAEARDALLNDNALRALGITRFEVGRKSLEDVFVEVMQA